MKLIIVTPYWLPIKGGVTTYTLNLAKTLQKQKNIRVGVITRIGKSDKDVYAIGTRCEGCFHDKILFVVKTFLILYKKRPDAIHSHSWWYTLVPSVLYKLFHPKTRLIHTILTEPMEEGRRNILKNYIFEWLLNRCDAITTSKNIMEKLDRIAKLKIRTRKEIIYGGFSRKKVSEKDVEEFKRRYSLENNHPILSWVGPLHYKMKFEGVKNLIGAFSTVVQKYPDARLFVIGDGPYRNDLEKFAEYMNIKNNVIFTGFLDNVFVPLSVTDIYMWIMAQDGGVGMALLEAMSVGKPIIATRSMTGEVLFDNENAILVDLDPKSIANAILALYEDKEKMKRLGENAQKTVEENFSWEKICEEFVKLYQPSKE